MKYIVLFLFLGLNISTSMSQDNPTDQANGILDKLVQANFIVGGSAGIMVDGEVVWEHASGYADKATTTAFQMQTVNRTASIAKSMTGVAVLQLVEKGLIDLDASIQTYIPEFPIKKEGTITVRHLLNHNSGIKGYKSGREAQTKKQYANLTEALTLFQDRDLLGAPGQVYNYTTYGYTVLGVIIERASGMSYVDYMKQHIWEPAEMENISVEVFGASVPNKSELYHNNGKGKLALSKKVNNLSNRLPGGGLQCTTLDLLKFGDAVLKNRLISEASTEQMWTAPEVTNEGGNAYGMGWFLYGDNPNIGPIYGHTGEQTGTSSILFVVPKYKMVIAIMTNTSLSLREVFGAGVQLFTPAKALAEQN